MSRETEVIDDELYYIIESSEVIEADSKKGRKFWQAHVVEEVGGQGFFTATSSWHTTLDGVSKKVWSTPFYAEPTNVGRANHRNNEEQAYFDFASMVKKKKDTRGDTIRILPMLAQKWEDRAKYITFPCAISPKLDGFRVLYDGEIAWTRGNKDVIPEVFNHLHFDTMGYTVDGELILPGFRPVNETMSAGKKFRAGISDTLQYHLFDLVDETLTYEQRLNLLAKIVDNANNSDIVLVEVRNIVDKDQVDEFHALYVEQGYEGSMIRNWSGLYEINKRSNQLQKKKDFLTSEYKICDIIASGLGSAKNVGKFICETEDGTQFEATATGPEELRQDYLHNKENYIGKYAVLKYIGLSGAQSVPFHANVLTPDRWDI